MIKDLLMIRKRLDELWAEEGNAASRLLGCCHGTRILSFLIYCYCNNPLGFYLFTPVALLQK